MKHSIRFCCAAVVVLMIYSCTPSEPPVSPEPPDTRAQDEEVIRAAIREWQAAAQAKDPERFVAAYAEDAILMFEDAPDIQGNTALREAAAAMMQDPNFAMSFDAGTVEVSRSSDLAYELGSYSVTVTDPKTKKPVAEKGAYVVIWKKQNDGTWKVIVDAPVSDPS